MKLKLLKFTIKREIFCWNREIVSSNKKTNLPLLVTTSYCFIFFEKNEVIKDVFIVYSKDDF